MDFKVIDLGIEPENKKLILVVDDELSIQTLIYDALIADYRILSAHTAKEGITRAENSKPHLILMDVMLPDMNGYDAVKQLGGSSSTRQIPVIVTTARDFDRSTIRMIRAEPNVKGFVPKPFRVSELREAVKGVIGPKK